MGAALYWDQARAVGLVRQLIAVAKRRALAERELAGGREWLLLVTACEDLLKELNLAGVGDGGEGGVANVAGAKSGGEPARSSGKGSGEENRPVSLL